MPLLLSNGPLCIPHYWTVPETPPAIPSNTAAVAKTEIESRFILHQQGLMMSVYDTVIPLFSARLRGYPTRASELIATFVSIRILIA